jgi:STE24 endopeptidase
MKSCGMAVPAEFRGMMDEGVFGKTHDYEADKTRFSFISSLFGFVITIVFIFGGLLNIFNSWVVSLNLPFLVSGWFFFILLFFASEALNIPFSLYGNFRIENRYGFNTMTLRLWFSDFTKSLIISVVVMTGILFAAFGLIQWSPGRWWIWLWGVMLAYGMFMMYISPYVIEPLFNKFSPVEDESLKEKILELAGRAGIRLTKVLKMDASRRSKHSNAYFTGIGRTKRIVLYDTLIEGMTQGEIIAVLAHEIGHWRRKHILKMMAAMEIISLITLYISFRLMDGSLLTGLFGIESPTAYAKFVIIGFLAAIASFPLRPVGTYFSRRNEKQADDDCLALAGNAEDAVSAFVKLAKENLSNLYPHPLYVIFYYSHPPILERIKYIRAVRKNDPQSPGAATEAL